MPFRILRLDEVSISAKERESLIDIMSNLPKMNEALKDDDLCDVETVRKMLKVELETKRRPATVGRLAGRLKTLIDRVIDAEVYQGA